MSMSIDCVSPTAEATPRERLVRLLASYLLASPSAGWPGTDGLTIGAVVAAAYSDAVVTGTVPGPAELARRHAELADLIDNYFGPANPVEGIAR